MIVQKQQLLIDAINAAQINANKFRDSPDDGSCNMDTVLIWFTEPFTKDQLAEVASRCKCSFGEKHTSGAFKGSRFLWIDYSGQAERRTKMMEAAMRSLRESGYTVCMWYKLD